MMIRFVEHAGQTYRLLLQSEEGGWLINCEDPAAPFFVDPAHLREMAVIETPEGFLLRYTREERSPAEQSRLIMIQPLLADDRHISDKVLRSVMAKELASQYNTTPKRILRLYYRYLATGALIAGKPRERKEHPTFDWAIRTHYFSAKQMSLRAAYEMMLVQRYTDGDGRVLGDAPTWAAFQHYFYKRQYHLRPEKIISREGLSHYQRNVRPIPGSTAAWRSEIGSFQMDATQADLYLVSRFDRSCVIGRPYIYLAVDTATQLIAGICVGMEAGETAVMGCLANAVTDKVSYCRQYGIEITPEEWPSQEMPLEIITDKGRDFCGKRMDELCMRYGVEHLSLPPFRPDGKGCVEKAFDLLQEKYKPLVRGYGLIEADAQERWAADYRAQAVLDIDQYIELLLHCVLFYNSGHVLSNGRTPAQVWLEAENRLLRVDPQELYRMSLPRTKLTLERKGFRCQSLWYVPEDFKRLLVGKSYTVAADRSDISRIYIVDDHYHPCGLSAACQQYAGITAAEYSAQKTAGRRRKSELAKGETDASIWAAKQMRKVVDDAIQMAEDTSHRQTGKEIAENRRREKEMLT